MGQKVWICDDEGSSRYPIYMRGNVPTGMIAQISQAAGASHLAAKAVAVTGDADSACQSYELRELSR